MAVVARRTGSSSPRIEDVLKNEAARSSRQVTKNPIAHKGARLTQEVSLPGPFRGSRCPTARRPTASPSALPDGDMRKRLRNILDKRQAEAEHGRDRAHRGRDT